MIHDVVFHLGSPGGGTDKCNVYDCLVFINSISIDQLYMTLQYFTIVRDMKCFHANNTEIWSYADHSFDDRV